MKLCPVALSLLLLTGLLCACAGQQAPVGDTTSDTTIAPFPVVPTTTEEDVDTVSDPTIIRSMIPNPAAVYCVDLGYDYQIVEEAGGQVGYCVLPDRNTCDDWDFLEGTCGQEYNYCAQQGYDTVTRSDGKNPFSRQYAVCVTEGGREVGQVTEIFNLMERSTGCEGETTEIPQREVEKDISQGDMKPVPVHGVAQPPSFDWRNHNGSNWVTSVKNQGGCGSCWAFSAVGATEAAHNIANDDPNLDLNLAEQYLVSRCLDAGTCCGGWHNIALQEIRDEGIPDEGCMPYVDGASCSCSAGCDSNCTYRTGGDCSDRRCSDRCSDWASRLETIGCTSYVGTDTTTIKERIVGTGPLAVALRMSGYFDANNIYRCDPDSPINHAVVVVGYNDNGGYWIVKNSWGATWHGNGYFNVGYGECSIEQYMYDAVVNCCNDPHEPNDTWGEATPIAYGDTLTDPDICPAGDVDYYAFTGSAGNTVVADIDAQAIGSDLDSYLYLYDTDGVTELTHNDDYDGLDSHIEYTLPANGTYYLWVREYNHPNEGASDYFYTLSVSCPTPSAPSLISPSNGSSTSDTTPTFSWGSVSGATSYRIQVDNNSSFSSPEINQTTSSTLYTPGTALALGTYYWRVRASNACGGSSWSSTWSFIIENNPPNPPSNPSPADGATGVSINADLSWIGGDPDPGDTVTYDVYFEANDSTPDNRICDDVSTPACDPGPLDYDTHYYWYVVATDNHGASTTGDTWNFTTEKPAVYLPIILKNR